MKLRIEVLYPTWRGRRYSHNNRKCLHKETQQIAQTTNIKSEFGSQTVLAMPSEVGAGNTVISSGQLNNLLLSTPAQLQPQLLDATQIQTQNQPILLPLPLHLQQTQLPFYFIFPTKC